MIRKKRVLFAMFLVVGMIVYANSVGNGFHYDDLHTVRDNPYVHSLSNFFKFFTDGRTSSELPENSGYRPLFALSSALCWVIGQGQTWPFHIFKILSHISIAWLIFLIALRLGVSTIVAAVAGLFFIVHPGNSETVNYISATSTLQCALFYLLAFRSFLKGGRTHLVLMSFFFFCSVLTKEEGATFPAVLVLYLWIYRDERIPLGQWYLKHLKPIMASVFVLVAYLFLYFHFKPASGELSRGSIPVGQYFATQIWAWYYYILWLFKPWGYSLEHLEVDFSQSFFEPRIMLAFAANLTLIYLAIKKRKEHRALAFGIGFYFITILPGSSVFVLAEPINEHRYYLSYSLLFVAVVQAFRLAFDSFRESQIWKPILVLLLVVFSTLTILRNRVWKDQATIWQDVIDKDPRNARAHNNLGIAYLALPEPGSTERALYHFLRCSEAWSSYKYCYLNQYIAYRKLGKMAEAKQALDQMLHLDSEFTVGLWYLAEYQFEQDKNPQKALQTLEKCEVNSQGRYVACLEFKARVLQHLKRYPEALMAASRGLELEPTHDGLKKTQSQVQALLDRK